MNRKTWTRLDRCKRSAPTNSFHITEAVDVGQIEKRRLIAHRGVRAFRIRLRMLVTALGPSDDNPPLQAVSTALWINGWDKKGEGRTV